MGVVFVAGNLALDYVGTLNQRFTRRVEQLHTPADFGRWLQLARIVDEPPPVTDEEFGAAIRLRELLFEVVVRQIDEVPPLVTAGERRAINDAAAAPPPVPALTPDAGVTTSGDAAAGLSAVAREAIALLDRTDGSVLKWCADDNCTHPFLDRSRGHRRRWCGMAGCGDRAKAAAYRERQRAAAE
jgi:predicted RNA-binding Zn ribbon-like protein